MLIWLLLVGVAVVARFVIAAVNAVNAAVITGLHAAS